MAKQTRTESTFETTTNVQRLRELYPAAADALDFEVKHFEILLNDPDAPVKVQAVTLEGDVANWCEAYEGQAACWDFM